MRLVITENQLDLKPFTLPLELVSDQFTNWSDLANQKIIWFTESSFQSTLGAFTQLP